MCVCTRVHMAENRIVSAVVSVLAPGGGDSQYPFHRTLAGRRGSLWSCNKHGRGHKQSPPPDWIQDSGASSILKATPPPPPVLQQRHFNFAYPCVDQTDFTMNPFVSGNIFIWGSRGLIFF